MTRRLDRLRRQWYAATMRIDGQSFRDLVRAAEEPFALKDERPDLAGRYEWLSVGCAAEQLCGDPGEVHRAPHKSILLGCICGVPPCWPLIGTVTFSDETVTWSDFEHGYEDWTYDDLGRFVFERTQYEQQLAKLARSG